MAIRANLIDVTLPLVFFVDSAEMTVTASAQDTYKEKLSMIKKIYFYVTNTVITINEQCD